MRKQADPARFAFSSSDFKVQQQPARGELTPCDSVLIPLTNGRVGHSLLPPLTEGSWDSLALSQAEQSTYSVARLMAQVSVFRDSKTKQPGVTSKL